MSPQIFLYIALGIYFAAMLFIGFIAWRKNQGHEDYMLGGRKLHPGVAALSAGASDMSGWLMMGLPGAIYAAGLIEAWIAIGLTIGTFASWKLVAPKLRAYTEVSRNSITLPTFFENRLRDKSHIIRIVSSLVILVFFVFYVSSTMVSGGVFFENSFKGDYTVGALLVSGVTITYTLFGGFLGATFTDVVQGLMLLAGLIFVPIVAAGVLGGPAETLNGINEIAPERFDLFAGWGAGVGGTLLVIVSSLAWGLGYFGQPHILVRYMALRSSHDAKVARRIGVTWTGLSLFFAVVAGFVGIAYFDASKQSPLENPEVVVLQLAQILFHPLIAGFVLAAVLAAVMSTLSSQLIVCASAIVEDIFLVVKKTPPSDKVLLLFGKLGVLVVSVIALILALQRNDSILQLVAFAWAGFGAAFGPLVLLSLYWRRLTRWGALAGMVTGSATVFIWKAMNTGLYELLPAFLVSMLTMVVVSMFTHSHNEEIEAEFTRTEEITTQPK